MELLMQEVQGHSDDRELEEEEEEEELEEEELEAEITKEESSSSKQYYPFFSTNFKTRQDSWLGLHDRHSPDATTTTDSHNSSPGLGLPSAPATNFFNNHSKPELMDLSLGIENRSTKDLINQEEEEGGGGNFHAPGSSGPNDVVLAIEKEHMFDKVVTPSDVGKLNRLVIPKQHAEKYFPLDSSSNEKGLLLNFEDRNGKLWRFRYSYWNSSQSYVMTKGWSRFVKEKKLDAGDIVSFQRGAGESHRHRLYIDYRRRPDHGPPGGTDPSLIAPFLLHQPQFSLRWGGRLYSLPSLPPPPMRPTTQVNYSNMFPFHQQQQQHNEQYHHHHHPWQQQQHFHHNGMSSGSGSAYQNLIGQQEGGNGNESRNVPMIINSVPVDNYYQRHLRYHHHHHHHSSSTNNAATTTTTPGKTLRLFGVNMECDAAASSSSSLSEEPKCCNVITAMANSSSSSSLYPPLQYSRMPHEDPISARFRNHHDQRGETSMLFNLDPSLQYKH